MTLFNIENGFVYSDCDTYVCKEIRYDEIWIHVRPFCGKIKEINSGNIFNSSEECAKWALEDMECDSEYEYEYTFEKYKEYIGDAIDNNEEAE